MLVFVSSLWLFYYFVFSMFLFSRGGNDIGSLLPCVAPLDIPASSAYGQDGKTDLGLSRQISMDESHEVS